MSTYSIIIDRSSVEYIIDATSEADAKDMAVALFNNHHPDTDYEWWIAEVDGG